MEVSLVLGIIALLVAAVMYFFVQAHDGARTKESMEELATIIQTVHNLYGSQQNYVGLTDQVVASSNQFPQKWIDATSMLRDPFYGKVVVEYSSNSFPGDAFQIEFWGLPLSACVAMATADLGPDVLRQGADEYPWVVGGPLPAAMAVSECSNGAYNEVTYVLR